MFQHRLSGDEYYGMVLAGVTVSQAVCEIVTVGRMNSVFLLPLSVGIPAAMKRI